MSLLSRSAAMIALTLGFGAAAVAAQEPGRGRAFRWYFGGEAGVLNYKTTAQTRGSVFSAGGHILVVAHRTGLMLGVDEAFGNDQVGAYTDVSGTNAVGFNHLRKYSAMLTAFPVKPTSVLQPYLGLGFGLLHAVNPTLLSPTATPAAQDVAGDRSSTGFGSVMGGLQFNLDRFTVFGQYQITTSPNRSKVLEGPTHAIMGGIRVSLGNANEGLSGGGY
jgi:opacity protein-like surface antigen